MEIDKKLKKFSKEFFSKSLNFLELKYIENKEGESIFTCNFKDTYSNPMGSVQGGMITAALDDATSAAMISGYDEKLFFSICLSSKIIIYDMGDFFESHLLYKFVPLKKF